MTATPIPRTRDDDACSVIWKCRRSRNCPAGGSRSTPIWSNPRSRPTGGSSCGTGCAKADRRTSWRRWWMNRQRSRHPASRRRSSNSPTASSKRFAWHCLHGRMTPAEKQEVMDRFRAGETQVLVSTSVIEVGVDVPNASVMTVAGAERFGLAQLHQLRGRVGRGSHPGFCGVLVSEELSEQGRERLDGVCEVDGWFRPGGARFSNARPRRFVRHAAAWLAAVAGRRLAATIASCWKKPGAKRSSWSRRIPS